MAKMKRCNEPTPCGGDYSEIHFFNDSGEYVDEKNATKCTICEYKADGTLLNEIHGVMNQD